MVRSFIRYSSHVPKNLRRVDLVGEHSDRNTLGVRRALPPGNQEGKWGVTSAPVLGKGGEITTI